MPKRFELKPAKPDGQALLHKPTGEIERINGDGTTTPLTEQEIADIRLVPESKVRSFYANDVIAFHFANPHIPLVKAIEIVLAQNDAEKVH